MRNPFKEGSLNVIEITQWDMNLTRPKSGSDATVQRSVLEHTFMNDERTKEIKERKTDEMEERGNRPNAIDPARTIEQKCEA